MLKQIAYCAVRRNEAGEWLDLATLSCDAISVIEKVKQASETIPKWAQDNPVTRYTRVVIIEAPDNRALKGWINHAR